MALDHLWSAGVDAAAADLVAVALVEAVHLDRRGGGPQQQHRNVRGQQELHLWKGLQETAVTMTHWQGG